MLRKLSDWLAYKQWQREYFLMSGVKSQMTFEEFLKDLYENKQ